MPSPSPSSISLVVHGHFYQPPRENPWSDELESEPSASPFHDWNARIHAECYRANAYARIHDRSGHIAAIENNYGRMSFNFGPTLARWIARHDPAAHGRLLEADAEQLRRLGAGGAMAQAYAHPILPLASAVDRRTQILWGLADFRRRFGREAEGLWLPETAANVATLTALIELGVRYTILAPEQVESVRAPGEEWTEVNRDTVDTGRAYRWLHPDGSGRSLAVGVFDGPLSRAVAFGETTHDASAFVAAIAAAAKRSSVPGAPLVLCASDGELFGHHKKFADMNLAFTTFVEGPKHGIHPTNLAAYLHAHPPTWEMKLYEGPDGKGSAWSCAHGVGRWWRDCGCSMVPAERGWNQRWRGPLRAALDRMTAAAADFFEDAGAELLVDPWGARDAYGEVIDQPIPERDALLREFGTAALLSGGEAAAERARLLMEMQRATLLMYASCAFYFDDIAGLEAGLGLRLCAYAADLMTEAGGRAPLADMLDLLASARSNQIPGQTGADVFNQMAGDRISPPRATATIALAKVASGDRMGTKALSPGCTVELLDDRFQHTGRGARIGGTARVTVQRTGLVRTVDFEATWSPERGLSCVAGGQPFGLADLGREDRHRLLPRLMPRLVNDADPRAAARLALQLARGMVGQEASAEPGDGSIRGAFADLLLRWLDAGALGDEDGLETALQLLDAGGPALAPGTLARNMVEERVAQLRAAGGAGTATGALATLAVRLGFGALAAPADPEAAL